MSAASQRVRARKKTMQQTRTDDILREARLGYERQQRQHSAYQRTVGNAGLYTGFQDPATAYADTKQLRRFELYHELVAKQLVTGVPLKGRPPVPFVVHRDEALFRPFGGFRVYWRDLEVGRTLSYPTYDDCKRLREWRRHSATPAERKLLSSETT
jgi:hypothetical protein